MKVAVFPRDPNPYQELLHTQLWNEGIEPDYLPMPTPSKTLNMFLLPVSLLRARLNGAKVLHLHWVFDFVLPYADRFTTLRVLMQGWFALTLFWAKLIGLRVVWTAHNVLPHRRVFWDDRRARALLLRHADRVIVHDTAVIPQLQRLSPDLPPVAVVPHGDYAGWYRSEGTPQQARERLGIPAGHKVFLFFGTVTEDKGVADLVTAYSRLCGENAELVKGTCLVVAGRCTDPALRARIQSAARAHPERVLPRLGFVPDGSVGDYLNAADLLTLPFRSATTRGTVVLARSFAKPLLLPDLPALRSVPEAACLRYDPADRKSLEGALVRACAAGPAELKAMGEQGNLARGNSTWTEAARLTAALYRGALARRPVSAPEKVG